MQERKTIWSLILAALGLGGVYWLSQVKTKTDPSSIISHSTSRNFVKNSVETEYQKEILKALEIWKERDNNTEQIINEVINFLKSIQPTSYKIKSVETLLNDYQEEEEATEESLWNEQSATLTDNYKTLQRLVQEWKKTEEKRIKNLKKDWFAPYRWLTDHEIDWALANLLADFRFKILPAYQFHYVVETKGEDLGFLQLLEDLNVNKTRKLVFVPVNNPDYHWSLLVYEVKSKSFWHYDTLNGTNDHYIKPLIKDLVIQLWKINESDFDQLEESAYLKTNYEIKQKNGHDCGTAVIEIVKAIEERSENITPDCEIEFDFKKAREDYRKKILEEIN